MKRIATGNGWFFNVNWFIWTMQFSKRLATFAKSYIFIFEIKFLNFYLYYLFVKC